MSSYKNEAIGSALPTKAAAKSHNPDLIWAQDGFFIVGTTSRNEWVRLVVARHNQNNHMMMNIKLTTVVKLIEALHESAAIVSDVLEEKVDRGYMPEPEPMSRTVQYRQKIKHRNSWMNEHDLSESIKVLQALKKRQAARARWDESQALGVALVALQRELDRLKPSGEASPQDAETGDETAAAKDDFWKYTAKTHGSIQAERVAYAMQYKGFKRIEAYLTRCVAGKYTVDKLAKLLDVSTEAVLSAAAILGHRPDDDGFYWFGDVG